MQISAGRAPSAPVVEVRDLEKFYGDVRALGGVSFEIPAGSVVGFLGPNGAGKTTAIKILTGYLAADAGQAVICGHDVETDGLQARSLIGYLPENNPLYSDMRVDQFLRFAWRAQSGAQAAESMAAAIDRVVQASALQSVYRKTIAACSKGFRQRVGLAQALLHDPPLLILDEPTNGLDPLQVVEIRELIRELGRTKTVLLTTHVLPEVEALADRVVLIHQGKKVADGSLDELAGAEGGATVRLVVRATQAQLQSTLQAAGLSVLQWLQAPHGDAACVGALLIVDQINVDSLEAISQAASNAQLQLLELAPQSGSLEALFRNLQRGEV